MRFIYLINHLLKDYVGKEIYVLHNNRIFTAKLAGIALINNSYEVRLELGPNHFTNIDITEYTEIFLDKATAKKELSSRFGHMLNDTVKE